MLMQGLRRSLYAVMALALVRTLVTKASSFNDARLISTLASAPVIAARARASAVVRSDFMLGLVMGSRVCVIWTISFAFSATPSGTAVACFSAAAIRD